MLGCEYCQLAYGHDYRCPNYIPPKASHYCSICGEGITNGEEYIVNDDCEYAHWECIDYGRDLATWLGYEIKEMEDDYEFLENFSKENLIKNIGFQLTM